MLTENAFTTSQFEKIIERVLADAERGTGPNCTHYAFSSVYRFPNTDADPTFVFELQAPIPEADQSN